MEIDRQLLQSLIDLLNNMWPVAFATFVGAFVGAWTAFQLQRGHERKKELAAQVAAGKSAQFVIVVQRGYLNNIKNQ